MPKVTELITGAAGIDTQAKAKPFTCRRDTFAWGYSGPLHESPVSDIFVLLANMELNFSGRKGDPSNPLPSC